VSVYMDWRAVHCWHGLDACEPHGAWKKISVSPNGSPIGFYVRAEYSFRTHLPVFSAPAATIQHYSSADIASQGTPSYNQSAHRLSPEYPQRNLIQQL
jgi:hypothetical protein